MAQKLRKQSFHIAGVFVKLTEYRKCFCAVVRINCVNYGINMLSAGYSRRLRNERLVNLFPEGSAAVKKRERVTHTAVGNSCYKQGAVGRELKLFLLGNVVEPPDYILGRNAFEVKALTTREYRCGKLMHLGRSKYELYVLGRLFKRFQKRVECARREHMNLVDYIYSVFDLRRRVIRFFAKIADIVNAVV